MNSRYGLLLFIPVFAQAEICNDQPISPILQQQVANIKEKESQRSFFSFREAHGLDLTATNEKKIGKVGIELGTGSHLYSMGIEGAINDDTKAGKIVDNKGIQTNGGKVKFGYTYLTLKPTVLESIMPNIIKQDKKIASTCKALIKCHKDNVGNEINMCKTQQSEYDSAIKFKLPDKFNILKKFNFVSINTSYGENEFKHFNLAENEFAPTQKEEAYDISLSYGGINYHTKSRWEFGFVYKNEYKFASSNNERNICREFPENADFQECFDARLFPAVENSSKTIFYEYSKIFDDPNRVIKGVSIKPSYNEKNKFSIELPIYLFQHKESGLIAGLEFGWNSEPPNDSNPFQVGVFFSMPLNLNRDL